MKIKRHLLTIIATILATTVGIIPVKPALANGPSVGGGIGIPYGIIGTKGAYEFDLSDNITIAPTLGLGLAFDAGLGWNIGVQSFFLKKDAVFRLGAGIWYGTNTYVDGFDDTDTGTGFSIGFTPRLQFGSARNHIVDFLVGYAVSQNYDDPCDDYNSSRYYSCKTSESSRFLLGAGYAYRF
jgi:hypothetical protein